MAAILLAGIGWAAEDGIVKGQYLEDRSSRVFGCPCEWSSEDVSNGREVVLAWQFQAGTYSGEDLAGLRVAAVLVGKFSLSDATTLRSSILYADAAAAERQRRAGVAWLLSRFGDLLGDVREVRTAPVEIQFALASAMVRVESILEVRLRQADFGLDTMPWATLLYEPLIRLTSSTLGTSLHTRYNGPELAIGWRRGGTATAITGYFGTFAIQ